MAKKLTTSIPRIALTPPEAAAAIGVGPDFFDANVAPELRLVRRGRKRLVPVSELERWTAENASRAWWHAVTSRRSVTARPRPRAASRLLGMA